MNTPTVCLNLARTSVALAAYDAAADAVFALDQQTAATATIPRTSRDGRLATPTGSAPSSRSIARTSPPAGGSRSRARSRTPSL